MDEMQRAAERARGGPRWGPNLSRARVEVRTTKGSVFAALESDPASAEGARDEGVDPFVGSVVSHAVVIERGPASYGAFVPDLPGCVAAGTTRNEVLALIREAIELRVDGPRRDGREVPSPRHDVEHVEVDDVPVRSD